MIARAWIHGRVVLGMMHNFQLVCLFIVIIQTSLTLRALLGHEVGEGRSLLLGIF